MKNTIVLSILALTCLLPGFLFSQGSVPDPSDYFSDSEIAAANTAVNTSYLTQEEKDIYLYSNLARMYPSKFYHLYRAFVIAKGKGGELTRNSYYSSLTRELKSMGPESTMYPDREMYELAKCWADESGTKGLVGHDREDCPKGFAGENCAYGYSTGMEIVIQLLIDEGVKDLGHRENLFYPDWKGMGAAISSHRDYRFCAVQNFARTNDELRKEEALRRAEEEKQKKERDQLLALRKKEFEEAMSQWDSQEMRAADVTRSLNYLNDLEKDLYFYTNLMRLYPKKFKELIWDKGPFFDQLLPELQENMHSNSNYKRVSEWLAKSRSLPAFVPDNKHISVLRCVVDRYLSGRANYRACFQFAGAWRFQTYYSESNFNDVMNILLTPKDFEDLFVKGSTMAIHKSEPSIKVFVTPN